jgi:hypothetical protein
MTLIADSKKRVVIPGAKPGDVFSFQQQDENHFLIVRLQPPPPRQRKTKAQIRHAILHSKMRPTMSWDELRALTRE